MNGPKSHLKGTLCPTPNTWPCCGQLRNRSSSSSGDSISNKQPAQPRPRLGGTEGLPIVQSKPAGRAAQSSVRSSCNCQPKVIFTCESFGQGLPVPQDSFLSSASLRDISKFPPECICNGNMDNSAVLLSNPTPLECSPPPQGPVSLGTTTPWT